MKYSSLALLGALLATSAIPALAAPNLSIPIAATAPPTNPNADISTFAPAAIADLTWNARTSKDANESTSAMLATDRTYLYVRFDASQSERIDSAAFVDGQTGGDAVAVDLWPAGAGGTHYHFAAAPDGTPGASASSGTAPAFQSSGTTYPGGYVVTMKIPLAALHGTPGSWNVQLSRTVAASGATYVWSHDGSGSPDGLAQAGTMVVPAAIGRN